VERVAMQIIEHEYEAEVRELQHSVFLAVRWFEKYKFNLLNVTKKKEKRQSARNR
jgi:hypothetical protein